VGQVTADFSALDSPALPADRLRAFAEANGLAYSASDSQPSYPGAIFREGTQRVAVDHLMTTSGRFIDVGEFNYTIPSGRGMSAVMRWGFIAIQLDRRLPHIVLEARAHSGWLSGELPSGIMADQKLGLEGDFDRHFTLYCPRGYEPDALYLFTPDLMALLIDEAGGMHVEIMDDWMFVCWQLGFGDTWWSDVPRLFRIIDVVGAKLLDQSHRYVDPEGVAGTVAAPGQRLRSGFSSYSKVFWVTGAIVGGVIAVAIAATVISYVLGISQNVGGY
jgi:hypothetical protein